MEEKINYLISTSVNEGIIEMVMTGEVTNNTFDRLRADVVTIIREKKAEALLCDIRALKGPNDISVIYHRSRSIPADVRVIPAAMVKPLDNSSFQSFHETTAYNAGQLIKYFTDIEPARAWLKGLLEEMRRK
jgi:hypothetical protein